MKTTGYINADGQYIKKDFRDKDVDISGTHKQYNHDKQRREHARELLQPYKEGKANPAFVEQYREESKAYGFIKE